jgi:hypothetical protein
MMPFGGGSVQGVQAMAHPSGRRCEGRERTAIRECRFVGGHIETDQLLQRKVAVFEAIPSVGLALTQWGEIRPVEKAGQDD